MAKPFDLPTHYDTNMTAFRVLRGPATKQPNDNLKRFACRFAFVSVLV